MFDLFEHTADNEIEELLATYNSQDVASQPEAWVVPYLLADPFVHHIQTPAVLQSFGVEDIKSAYTRIVQFAFDKKEVAWTKLVTSLGNAAPAGLLQSVSRMDPEVQEWFLGDVFCDLNSAKIEECRELLMDISLENSGDGVDIAALEAIRTFTLLTPTEFNLHIGMKIRHLEIHRQEVQDNPVQYSISGRSSDEEHASHLAGERAQAIAEYINELQSLVWHN